MFNRDHLNYGSRAEPLQAHEVIMSGIRKRAEQSELEKLREQNRELLEALKAFTNVMSRWGEWDEGCFYYNHTAAPELQEPIENADRLIRKAEGK